MRLLKTLLISVGLLVAFGFYGKAIQKSIPLAWDQVVEVTKNFITVDFVREPYAEQCQNGNSSPKTGIRCIVTVERPLWDENAPNHGN